jgi:histidinol dehydrogenase
MGLLATYGDFVRAFERLYPKFIQEIDYSVENILKFHEAKMPEEMWM